jgi:hypothetical protein
VSIEEDDFEDDNQSIDAVLGQNEELGVAVVTKDFVAWTLSISRTKGLRPGSLTWNGRFTHWNQDSPVYEWDHKGEGVGSDVEHAEPIPIFGLGILPRW